MAVISAQSVCMMPNVEVQGIPIETPPYCNDGIVAAFLLCVLIVAATTFGKNHYVARLSQAYFHPNETGVENIRTADSFYTRLLLQGNTLFTLAILLNICIKKQTNFDATLGWAYTISCILLPGIIYLLKHGIFGILNYVFQSKELQKIWKYNYTNLVILSGIPLLFILTVVIFLPISIKTIFYILLCWSILVKICLFYKGFYIFCTKKYGVLQLIAYLCALELIPLLMTVKVLVPFI